MSYEYDCLELWDTGRDPAYSEAYEERFRFAIESLSAFCPPPARVLDIAAAQGNFTIEVALRGYDAVWNDLRGDLQGYVEQKAPPSARLSFQVGNVFELPQRGVLYDAVLMCEVIEHVAHPDRLLASVARLLRPGGIVVLTTPNGGFVRNPLPRFSETRDRSTYEATQFRPDADGHLFLLTPDELAELAHRAGLHLEKVETFTNFLSHGWLGTRRLRQHTPIGLLRLLESQTRRLPVPVRDRLSTQLGAVLSRPQ
jgi:2-polyprenyl-3-methyl-5-hydroxy-6-metoxy-1,4-benzoquinol methylase